MDFLWDGRVVLVDLGRLVAAFVLALPLGWDRARHQRSAGLRTFPLVALASCGYVLLARAVVGGSVEAEARILQGLITGIGFIGGGAILKSEKQVVGTATATSIWSTGAIGAAAAFDRLSIAALLAGITFATLRVLTPLKKELDEE